MTVATAMRSGTLAPDVRAGIARRFAQIAVFLVLEAAILFGGAGTIAWRWAWVYLAICVASVSANAVVMLRRCPELIAERGRPREATQRWDKIIGGLWTLAVFVALPLIAALDLRWNWTTFALSWHIGGAIALAAGLMLSGWAMLSNAFFSTAVRIQLDRGQNVCRTGPYRFVRHPGYSGFTLQTLATPIILGSLWALLPAAAAATLMIIRTVLEDRLLNAKLPGYAEYAREVRVRLVPGIW